MAKKKAENYTANQYYDLLEPIDELIGRVLDAASGPIDGSAKELRDLQRKLILAARDCTQAASKLYTLITMAENRATIAQLEGKKG